MGEVIAHTKIDAVYPGYINIKPADDGGVIITVRGDPTSRDGCFVCGYARDKGKPGRCTAGDDHCNNYCNMAPEKGAMADSPLPTVQVFEGETAVLKLSNEDWRQLLQQATSGSAS